MTPDCRQGAAVPIAKPTRETLVTQPTSDQSAEVFTLLLGDSRKSGQRLAVRPSAICRITDDENIGVAWEAEIGADFDLSRLRRENAEPIGDRARLHPGTPDHGGGFDPPALCRNSLFVDLLDGGPHQNV